jgi:CDGSH-type Zn-finger protein
MPRLVKLSGNGPIKIDPNLAEGATPSAPNVRPWPRDDQGNLKVLSICTCGMSLRFPFCDGSHKVCKDEDAAMLYSYEAGTRVPIGPHPTPPAAS